MFASNIDQLLLFRGLQGLGGGVSAALSPAIIRDRFSERESGKIIAQMSIFILLTPAAAPILGGYLTTHFGWRSCFVFIMASVLISFLLFFKFFPETHPEEHRTKFRLRPLLRAYKQVLSNRSFFFYVLVHALPSAGIFCYITTLPFVFIKYMGVPTEVFRYYVFGQILMISFTSFLVQRIIASKSSNMMMSWGLGLYLIGSLGCLTAATLFFNSPVAATLLALPYFMANAFIFPTSMAKAMSFAGNARGAAASCIATARQFFAFLGSFIAAILPDASLLPTSIFLVIVTMIGIASFYLAQRWEKVLAHGTAS